MWCKGTYIEKELNGRGRTRVINVNVLMKIAIYVFNGNRKHNKKDIYRNTKLISPIS